VAAEIALENASVFGAVEHCAPGFQFLDASGSFLGVQLGHAPVIRVLAAAHGVREMNAPVIAVVDIGERRRDAAFGHDRVRFAQERLADQANRDSGRGSFDRRSETGATGADHQHIMFVRFVISHFHPSQLMSICIFSPSKILALFRKSEDRARSPWHTAGYTNP
jgi:hypothetical protein